MRGVQVLRARVPTQEIYGFSLQSRYQSDHVTYTNTIVKKKTTRGCRNVDVSIKDPENKNLHAQEI